MNKLTIAVLVALSLVSIYARADVPPPPGYMKSYQIEVSGPVAKAMFASMKTDNQTAPEGKCARVTRTVKMDEEGSVVSCEGDTGSCYRAYNKPAVCKITTLWGSPKPLTADDVLKITVGERAPSSTTMGHGHGHGLNKN